MDVTAHPEDAPLRKRFKISAVAAVVTIAVSIVVWAYTSFATFGQVERAEQRVNQKSDTNATTLKIMREQQQRLQSDVAVTKESVSDLKDAAKWQMNVILEIAKERQLAPTPPPTMETANKQAEEKTP